MSRDIKGLTQTPTYAAIMKRFDTNLTCSWMAPLPTPSICPFLIMFIASYPADCPPRRVETGKPESGISSSFDEPMVLLDEVVEVSALSELRGHGEHAFLLQLLDGRWIGVAPIDVDDPRRLMLGSLQHLAEEPFG